MSVAIPSRRESWSLVALFCAALLVHIYCVTLNWTVGFMSHQEFRQAQTAIISYYIDEQNNFSLLYETPVVGKPWVSILLEVPVYEWSVVLVSRATGLSHLIAARTISLICFYLALPAIYLLLGRLAITRPRRLLVLALILTAPLYIFYSRAFLMESMELAACAWFLLGFVRTMDERRWSWLALTNVAGIGAALIKSATFAIWLLPAAGYGFWLLWQAVRARQGWRAPLHTMLWGAATIAVPLGALRWWVNLTDPIKAAHASAHLFTSKTLTQGNWGLFDYAASFSPKVWAVLLGRWQEGIMTPWIVVAILVLGLVAFKVQRWRIAGLAAVFFLAQLLFPFAYAYQDYYYYACTVFLLAAIGVILHGVLDSRLRRWVCWLLIAVPFGAQLSTYWHGYRVDQIAELEGGFNYTAVLRDFTPKKSIIIGAGNDWCAIIPFYAQHRALMIRNGLEFDAAYLNRALDDLAGEEVSALVLVGQHRYNAALLNLVATRFDMDKSTPTMSENETDIYLSRPYIQNVQAQIRASKQYPWITIKDKPVEEKPVITPYQITPEVARKSFWCVSPAPYQAYFATGVGNTVVGEDPVIIASPDCDLWVHPPAGATRVEWDFGLLANSYERAGDKTDGVEYLIFGETPDGRRRQLYRRVLDPANHSEDRGTQHAVVAFQPLPGESLIFSDRRNLSESYDWAYWMRIEVK